METLLSKLQFSILRPAADPSCPKGFPFKNTAHRQTFTHATKHTHTPSPSLRNGHNPWNAIPLMCVCVCSEYLQCVLSKQKPRSSQVPWSRPSEMGFCLCLCYFFRPFISLHPRNGTGLPSVGYGRPWPLLAGMATGWRVGLKLETWKREAVMPGVFFNKK